jgi:hypothetical protein
MAVGVGFEPTEPFEFNNFQDCRFKPLSHPTNFVFYQKLPILSM